MSGPAPDRRPISSRLRFRVAALLALALLPIGIVGVILTRDFAQEVKERSELSLLAMSERAVFGERQVLDRAVGAGEALVPIVTLIREDPAACRAYLLRYLAESRRYSFVGFMPDSGLVTCSSSETVLDFRGNAELAERLAAPRLYIDRIETPLISDDAVVNLVQPVYEDQTVTGFLSISVPAGALSTQPDRDIGAEPLGVIVVNADGDVLSREGGEGAPPPVPQTMSLAQMAGSSSQIFRDVDQSGAPTLFAVVPIIPFAAYGVIAWPPDALAAGNGTLSFSTTIFPLLMWSVTLIVAFLAVDRLVGRYVRSLSRHMRLFATERRLPDRVITEGAASELQELESSFVDMAYALMDDEARVEDALRERNVLLKEVHHRVKNNLQLISSIMNMNMRTAASPETISVLRRLQDRLLGLSTVHRNLYQSNNVTQTNAAVLLRDLMNQVLSVGLAPGSNVEVTMAFDDATLYPDQAVPLSMLATELATNALKHIGTNAQDRPWIRIALHDLGEGVMQLDFANSTGDVAMHPDEGGSGLGSKLVQAFAMQVGSEVETEVAPDSYKVSVRFALQGFVPERVDP